MKGAMPSDRCPCCGLITPRESLAELALLTAIVWGVALTAYLILHKPARSRRDDHQQAVANSVHVLRTQGAATRFRRDPRRAVGDV